MLRAQAAGAVIFPIIPSFYHRPRTIDDLVIQFCCRVLALLGLEQTNQFRWMGLGAGENRRQ
jgi:3-polyprenyl-4-hydroxybenzoate decarboxylase